MSKFSGAVAWFENPDNRKAIYSLALVLVPVLVAAGALTDGVASTVLTALGLLLGTGVPALARKHVHKTAP